MKKLKSKNNINRVLKLIFEVGSLRRIYRSHNQTLLTNDISDNIATHSFRVAMIGYFLAKFEKVNVNKVILMCLIHDFIETRSGDQNWVHKRYVKVYEDEILDDQFKGLFDNEIYQVAKEYHKLESKEAKLAKDADLLDQILLLREYEFNGNKEASLWLKGKEQEKRLYSRTAKILVKKMYKVDVHCWWDNLWTDKRR